MFFLNIRDNGVRPVKCNCITEMINSEHVLQFINYRESFNISNSQIFMSDSLVSCDEAEHTQHRRNQL